MRLHTGAAIACYQFLGKDDAITKQAIKYTERIIDKAKKIPKIAPLKQAFEMAVQKMKKPDRLERTDFVQAEIPVALNPEFEEIY